MNSITRLTLSIYIPFLILGVIWSIFRDLPWLETIRFDSLSLFNIFISTTFLVIVNLFVIKVLSHRPFFRSIIQILDEKIYPIFKHIHIFDIVILSMCAGICEEIIFRGVLQEEVGRIFVYLFNFFLSDSNKLSIYSFAHIFGIIPGGILFGMAHTFSKEAINLGIWITMMGLFLGFLFSFTESIIVVIGCHALYDAFIMIYVKRYYEPLYTKTEELLNSLKR